MHAAYFDRVSAVLIRVLLAKGADVNVSGEGETPLSLAAKRGDTEGSRLLLEAQSRSGPSRATANNQELSNAHFTRSPRPLTVDSGCRAGLRHPASLARTTRSEGAHASRK